MILTDNGCILFIKLIYWFDIYIIEIYIYLNYNHYMSISEDNINSTFKLRLPDIGYDV